MPFFYVQWAIETEADSPVDAARKARQIHQDQESIATVFHVQEIVGADCIEDDEAQLGPMRSFDVELFDDEYDPVAEYNAKHVVTGEDDA